MAGDRRWPLCELEFELKGGDAEALAALAARWVARFGLTLDIRTKAERGDRLARGVRLGAPVKAQPLAPARGRGQPRRAARGGRQLPAAGAGQCQRDRARGRHRARASAPAARGPAPAAHGAARTGCACRRRSVPGWAEALAQPLCPAGHARAIAMRWRRRCCRPCARPAPAGWSCRRSNPNRPRRRRCASTATTRLWLELLAFAAGTHDVRRSPSRPQCEAARWRGCSGRCGAMPRVSPHSTTWRGTGLRKRVKRLRYLSEFAASLFRARDVQSFQKRLAPGAGGAGRLQRRVRGARAVRARGPGGRDGDVRAGLAGARARRLPSRAACAPWQRCARPSRSGRRSARALRHVAPASGPVLGVPNCPTASATFGTMASAPITASKPERRISDSGCSLTLASTSADVAALEHAVQLLQRLQARGVHRDQAVHLQHHRARAGSAAAPAAPRSCRPRRRTASRRARTPHAGRQLARRRALAR